MNLLLQKSKMKQQTMNEVEEMMKVITLQIILCKFISQ